MMKPAFTLLALFTSGTVFLACEDSTNGGVGDPPDAATVNTPDSGTPDTGTNPQPEGCPKPTAGPTEHQGPVDTETWTADKSPHIIKGGDVGLNGTLTIEPCAEVQLGELKGITVNAKGKLVAEGVAGKRIRFSAIDPQKPFAQLKAGYGGTMRFAYADISGGGAPQNSAIDTTGTIYAQGSDQMLPSQEIVFVDNVTVSGSRSNGLYLADGAGFAAGSKDLTVTGAANFVMSISPRAITNVPSGTYTGNQIDEIVLPGGGGANAVQENATMHDRGVPYRIGNSLTAGGLVVEALPTGLSTLTIEPGATLRFKKGGQLIVETFSGTDAARGALVAVGTAAKPIVFTSAEATPAAGDWVGISFNSVPAAVDKIEHARVEYAGALTSSGSQTCNIVPGIPDAAIRVRGVPAGQFITNTTIHHSAAHGIDRGWADNNKVDFLLTNTFTNVVDCNQTYPRDTNGSCPSVVPCPK